MARVSNPIVLDERHIIDLENLVRYPPSEMVAKRAQVILECGKGLSNSEISASIGMDAHYVAHWRNVYLDQGIDGLRGEHGGGQKPTVSFESLEKQIDILLSEQDHDWTIEQLSQSTGASAYMVSEVLRKKQISLKRQRVWSFSTENEILSKSVDIVGLYLTKTSQAFIVCTGANGAPDQSRCGEFLTRNRLLSEELESYNGPMTLGNVINTSAWHTKDTPTRGALSLSEYLTETLKQLPEVEGQECHLFICSDQETFRRGDRFSNVYVTKSNEYSEWLTSLEHWVTSLGDRSKGRAIDELIMAIQGYMNKCMQSTSPFIWRKVFGNSSSPEPQGLPGENEQPTAKSKLSESSIPSGLTDEMKVLLKKHFQEADNRDTVRCGFISFVYDEEDIDLCIVEGKKDVPSGCDSDFEELGNFMRLVNQTESSVLEARNNAGVKAGEMVLGFLKKKHQVNGLCKPARIDGELGRMEIPLPLHLERHLHNNEMIRTAGLLKQMCGHATHSSYRIATDQINSVYHRYEAGCSIPTITLANVVVNNGAQLIQATERHTKEVLLKYGFGEDGLLPPGTSLPEALQNKELKCIVVSPSAIMASMNLPLPVVNINPVNKDGKIEYSQPETGLHPRQPKRRGKRVLLTDEYRLQEMTDYVKFVNTLPGRPPGAMVIRDWSFEKYAADIVNIYIDADLVAEQEEKRVKGGKPVPRTNRTNIKHYDIRLETDDGGRFNITSTDMDQAYKQLLAVLLENHLTSKYFHFFIDGETILFEAIAKYFRPWHYSIFLDFFHVQEKCENLLSLAIKTKKVPSPWKEPEIYVNGSKKGEPKKIFRVALSRTYASVVINYLWYGNVEAAIYYLKNIKPDFIVNTKALNDLITYLDPKNKGKYITCYALRNRVGLKNSSNSSELANNLMVSSRQKVDDRMHWIERGSASLAALSALFLNEHEDLWFEKQEVCFMMYYKVPTMTRTKEVSKSSGKAA